MNCGNAVMSLTTLGEDETGQNSIEEVLGSFSRCCFSNSRVETIRRANITV